MNIKEIVNKCIIGGNFTLHSGERSSWICNLLKEIVHFGDLYWSVLDSYTRYPGLPVGLELGGALLVMTRQRSIECGIIRKDTTLYLPEGISTKRITLIDDVCTTGASLKVAKAKILSIYPEAEIICRCVLDRRTIEDRLGFLVKSLVTWEEVMPHRL